MNKKALLIISGLAVVSLGAIILIAMNVAKPAPTTTTAPANVNEKPPETNANEAPAPGPTGQMPVQGGTESVLIRVSSPTPNTVVTSPLTVTGEARGNWYFEAQFPVKLYDAQGNLLASGPAHAQGDWMTDAFVPFTVTLDFKKPTTDTGALVLEKDNPSGLPQNEAHVSIDVRFSPTAVTAGDCKPSGCSGQVCSDQPVITDCVYRAEYACYKDATCERQADGQCGWTKSGALTACLANPPKQ